MGPAVNLMPETSGAEDPSPAQMADSFDSFGSRLSGDEEQDEDAEGWVIVPRVSGLLLLEEAADGGACAADVAAAVVLRLAEAVCAEGLNAQPADAQFELYAEPHFRLVRRGASWIIDSLLAGDPLSLCSSSRSGSWIFCTADERLILKKVRSYEKAKLLEMAADYVDHLLGDFPSLLCPIYACCRYTHRGCPMDFVLMGSSYPPALTLRGLFDLKGSTANRTVLASSDAPETCRSALKDNDLTAPVRLMTEESWRRLRGTLLRDSLFLKEHDIFDYSLLVALADAPRGSGPGQSLNCLPSDTANQPTGSDEGTSDGIAVHRSWPCARRQVAYLGIIDYLTPWSILSLRQNISILQARSLEYFMLKYIRPDCSLMPPLPYQQRFVRRVLGKFSYPGQLDDCWDPRLAFSPWRSVDPPPVRCWTTPGARLRDRADPVQPLAAALGLRDGGAAGSDGDAPPELPGSVGTGSISVSSSFSLG